LKFRNNAIEFLSLFRDFCYLLSQHSGFENDGSNTTLEFVGKGSFVTSSLDLSSFTSIENTGVVNINITW